MAHGSWFMVPGRCARGPLRNKWPKAREARAVLIDLSGGGCWNQRYQVIKVGMERKIDIYVETRPSLHIKDSGNECRRAQLFPRVVSGGPSA